MTKQEAYEYAAKVVAEHYQKAYCDWAKEKASVNQKDKESK